MREKLGIVSEAADGKEEIDVNDLTNVLMDVSLDVFG